MALRRVFGATSKVAEYWDADDSGIAVQPRKGSNVPPHLRVHFWVAHTAQTFLSGTHLQALNERFVLNLKKQIDAKGVGDKWVEYPDLYAFVQSMVGRSATDTLMGPRLLELSPGLLDDFRVFDNNLLNFLFGRRRWMARAAYQARDHLLEAVARWHGEAQEKAGANVDRTAPEDPEFDTYFGSKLLRSRQSAMMKMGLDGHDKAALDVGLMFAYVHIPISLDVEGLEPQKYQLTLSDYLRRINSNVLRAIFWFIFHTLRDSDLRSELLAEARKCRRADGLFDVAELVKQPLLQSTFAEVCRFYVAIGVSRTVNHSPLKLGQWAVPVGETLSVFNREAAFNDEAWAASGREPGTPLANFNARRFLVTQNVNATAEGEPQAAPEFSLDGLAGCWLPFGGGQRMCPGRHFAKSEMLGTFAMLLTDYELELAEGVGDIQPDLRWYPTGTLPPKEQVPFRVRRKTGTQD